MNVVFRYPLRIASTHAEILRQWSCSCRYLWNRTLRLKQRLYERYKKNMGFYGPDGTNHRLTVLRGRYEWLAAVPNCTQQKVLMNLEAAFKNFFRRVKQGQNPGFPKFKNRSELPGLYFSRERFSITQDEEGRYYLDLSKMSQGIRVQVDRPFIESSEDRINSCTITYENGNWFACLLVEKPDRNYTIKNTNPSVGLDMGVAQTYTLSNGDIYQIDIQRIKYLEDRIAHLQKHLSVKVGSKKGQKKSNRWLILKKRIGRLQSELSGIRRNFNHQTSHELVNKYSIIAIEDLKVSNMTASAAGTKEDPGSNVAQKSGLNRAILRNGWHQLRTMLEYKAKWNNVNVIIVPPQYTSQKCSACGFTDATNRVSQSVFKCKQCGYSANADVNAATNILNKAPVGSPG